MECAEQGRKIKADYLLCDPRLDAGEIRENLSKDVDYKDAIDISFVESCVAAGKVVLVGSFRLRESQDLKK